MDVIIFKYHIQNIWHSWEIIRTSIVGEHVESGAGGGNMAALEIERKIMSAGKWLIIYLSLWE